MLSDIRCVAESGDELGEGPVWVAAEGRLYWFDIQGRRLNWLEHATGAWGRFELPVRASVATPLSAGGLILVTEAGLAEFDTAAGRFSLREPMTFEPGFRTNDGKIDLAGRLWWSTMDDDGGKRPGALYRTDPDGRTHRVLGDIHIANTVSCCPDGATFYLADSLLTTLWAFPIEADGTLGARREFANTHGEAGAADGSAVDAEGFIWNAQWGAARIVRYAPDGRIDRIVDFPVTQVSSCAFGGPDLTTLYATTAWEGFDAAARAAQPLAGNLFAFEPGVAGLALPAFQGRVGG
jgi:sugar lactone lactonase YvrE